MPIQLLIYATQTAVTTLTCIADYMAWPDYANSEKVELSKLYVPYLAVGMWKRERKEKKRKERDSSFFVAMATRSRRGAGAVCRVNADVGNELQQSSWASTWSGG